MPGSEEVQVTPLGTAMTARVRALATGALLASGLIVLVCWMNVFSIALTRGLYRAPEIATRSAAYALAQAEEADRHTWLIATRLAGPLDPNGNPTEIGDSGTLRGAWNSIREAGFRGVYLDPKEMPKAVSFSQDLSSVIASESATPARGRVTPGPRSTTSGRACSSRGSAPRGTRTTST